MNTTVSMKIAKSAKSSWDSLFEYTNLMDIVECCKKESNMPANSTLFLVHVVCELT